MVSHTSPDPSSSSSKMNRSSLSMLPSLDTSSWKPSQDSASSAAHDSASTAASSLLYTPSSATHATSSLRPLSTFLTDSPRSISAASASSGLKHEHKELNHGAQPTLLSQYGRLRPHPQSSGSEASNSSSGADDLFSTHSWSSRQSSYETNIDPGTQVFEDADRGLSFQDVVLDERLHISASPSKKLAPSTTADSRSRSSYMGDRPDSSTAVQDPDGMRTGSRSRSIASALDQVVSGRLTTLKGPSDESSSEMTDRGSSFVLSRSVANDPFLHHQEHRPYDQRHESEPTRRNPPGDRTEMDEVQNEFQHRRHSEADHDPNHKSNLEFQTNNRVNGVVSTHPIHPPALSDIRGHFERVQTAQPTPQKLERDSGEQYNYSPNFNSESQPGNSLAYNTAITTANSMHNTPNLNSSSKDTPQCQSTHDRIGIPFSTSPPASPSFAFSSPSSSSVRPHSSAPAKESSTTHESDQLVASPITSTHPPRSNQLKLSTSRDSVAVPLASPTSVSFDKDGSTPAWNCSSASQSQSLSSSTPNYGDLMQTSNFVNNALSVPSTLLSAPIRPVRGGRPTLARLKTSEIVPSAPQEATSVNTLRKSASGLKLKLDTGIARRSATLSSFPASAAGSIRGFRSQDAPFPQPSFASLTPAQSVQILGRAQEQLPPPPSMLVEGGPYPAGDDACASSSRSEDEPARSQLDGAEIPFEVSSILPDFLFLGPSIQTQENLDQLKQMGVRRVLNVAAEIEEDGPLKVRASFGRYLKLPMLDSVEATGVQDSIKQACQFLDDARLRSEAVYVHCRAGKSRSVMIVIAYLIHALRWPLQKAYAFVGDRRSAISPNIGFVAELMKYEQRELHVAKSSGIGDPLPTLHMPSKNSSSPGSESARFPLSPSGSPVSAAPNASSGLLPQSSPQLASTAPWKRQDGYLALPPTRSTGAGHQGAPSTSDAESKGLDLSANMTQDGLRGVALLEMEIKDDDGRYHSRRLPPVDETSLAPARRVSLAGLESQTSRSP